MTDRKDKGPPPKESEQTQRKATDSDLAELAALCGLAYGLAGMARQMAQAPKKRRTREQYRRDMQEK